MHRPMIPRTGRLLALDWGEVRIGVAVSDETQLIASPRATLTRRAGKRFPMPSFLALIEQEQPVGLVVGLPLTAEGAEGPAAASAREMGTLAAGRSGLPLEFVDERFTTARVLGTIREMGGSTRGRKAEVDAHAAAVLLQGYLDMRRNG
ncbi:MAG TPA: Holliday junction resolvase RuvX [Gemmatimonadales bacterium]|nr:Holliday junction resolvase RuvX [Gemmatimonadales bacterium]